MSVEYTVFRCRTCGKVCTVYEENAPTDNRQCFLCTTRDLRKLMKPKLLIIGHARHGKDTVAEILRDEYGYKFTSSSLFVAQEVMWDNWGVAVYDTFEEMFEDRVNHRKLWADMISAYNTPDKTKTAWTMLDRGFDMYVGMRKEDEIEACREANIFDYVIWVDRSDHLPDEPFESMELTVDYADYVIDNNGTLEDLKGEVKRVAEYLS